MCLRMRSLSIWNGNQSDTLGSKHAGGKECRISTVFSAQFYCPSVTSSDSEFYFSELMRMYGRTRSRDSSSRISALCARQGARTQLRMRRKDAPLLRFFERSFSANCTGLSRDLRSPSGIDPAESLRWSPTSTRSPVISRRYRWPRARLARDPAITRSARRSDPEEPSLRTASWPRAFWNGKEETCLCIIFHAAVFV